MNEPNVSGMTKEELLVMTKDVVSSIRKARIEWLDANDQEIAVTVIDCMPGDQISIQAPHPTDVAIE